VNRVALFVALTALFCAGCPPTTTDAGVVDAGADDPERFCPGQDGCTSSTGALRAGAAKLAFTPTAYEVANPRYLKNDRPDSCEPGKPSIDDTTCGELKLDIILDDCGRDAICNIDPIYVAPDADGTEGDGKPDYFLDCGRDRACPGDPGYTAPDVDGSEGDGEFQGLWIAGYGNNRPAMGVKDDVWARALVVETGDTTAALVTVDAVGLFYDDVERIRSLVDGQRPGAIDLVIVQATHTHEAPDTLGQWGLENPFTGLQQGHGRSDDFMDALRVAACDATVLAYDNLAPARVAAGTVNTRVDGFLHDSRDPLVFIDLLTAMSFTTTDGDLPIATVVHWGNHPEILDSRNNYVSSDYAHTLRTSLENGLVAVGDRPAYAGRGGVAIYQQGTVGGLMGPNGFDFTGRDGTLYENRMKTWARCDAYGELLAEQAFLALEGAVVVDEPHLSFAAEPYEVPVKNRVFQVGFFNGWFDRALVNFDPDMPINDENLPWLTTEAAIVRLGPLAWLTAPGEMFPETWAGFSEELAFGLPQIDPENPNPPDLAAAPQGPFLVEKVDASYPMLLGLALDETGYLVPPYDFELDPVAPYIEDAPGDHYEETNSTGPDAVPLLESVYELLFAFEARQRE
jgi:hypothetical protein